MDFKVKDTVDWGMFIFMEVKTMTLYSLVGLQRLSRVLDGEHSWSLRGSLRIGQAQGTEVSEPTVY